MRCLTRKFLPLTLGALAFVSSQSLVAGQMGETVAPARSWTGLYVGGQLGGAWNESYWQYTNHNYFNILGPTLLGTDFKFSSNGIEGGGFLGGNYEFQSLVLGIEAAAIGADLSNSIRSIYFPETDQYSTHTEFFSTVKGRLGYDVGHWLPYATGGWAGGNLSLTLTDQNGGITTSSSMWANGWTAGGGIDFRFTPQCTVGLAYDYLSLQVSNKSMTCPECGSDTSLGMGAPRVSSTVNTQMVSARLSYFFYG